MTFQPEDRRKHHNVFEVLPADLAREIMEHVRGCTIYVPARAPIDRRDRAVYIRKRFTELLQRRRLRTRRAAVSTIAKELGVSGTTVRNYLRSSKHLIQDEDEAQWIKEHTEETE